MNWDKVKSILIKIIRIITCFGIGLLLFGAFNSDSYTSAVFWTLALLCAAGVYKEIPVLKDVNGGYFAVLTVFLVLVGLFNINTSDLIIEPPVDQQTTAVQDSVKTIEENSKDVVEDVIARNFENQKDELSEENTEIVDIEEDNIISKEEKAEENQVVDEKTTINDVEEIIDNYEDSKVIEDDVNGVAISIDDELSEEDEFKSKCIGMSYKALNTVEGFFGSYNKKYKDAYVHSRVVITKEIRTGEYWALEESDAKSTTRSYHLFQIVDKRVNKEYSLFPGMVITVYGKVSSIGMNRNGGYSPTIDASYIEYIKLLSDDPYNPTDLNEELAKRNKEAEEIKKKNDEINSIYSDYNGTTKNVAGMEELSEKEFKECCDAMNTHDMNDEHNYALNKYVKLHLKVDDRMEFIIRPQNYLTAYNVKDTYVVAGLYNERTKKYEGIHEIYFSDSSKFEGKDLKKGQEIIVYGKVIKTTFISTGNMFEMVAWYVE